MVFCVWLYENCQPGPGQLFKEAPNERKAWWEKVGLREARKVARVVQEIRLIE